MSKRFMVTQPQNSKNMAPRQTKLKPGIVRPLFSRQTMIGSKSSDLPPLSTASKRMAYDLIKKIQNLQRQKGGKSTYQQIIKQFRTIVKNDIQVNAMFPDEAKTQVGRALLADGTFHVALAKINLRYQYITKKLYIQNLRDKYLPKVHENVNAFQFFLQQQLQKFAAQQKQAAERRALQQEIRQRQLKQHRQQMRLQREQHLAKIMQDKQKQKKQENQEKKQNNISNGQHKQRRIEQKEVKKQEIKYPDLNQQQTSKQSKSIEYATMTDKQQLIRKSILKPSKQTRKSVSWSQIADFPQSQYIAQVIKANKQHAAKQKKQKDEQLKKQEEQRMKELRIKQIKQDQSFLIDFFQINDVYDHTMIDICGIIDQIQDKYAIILLKEKPKTPEPSYVKTRKTYELENQHKKASKQLKQVLGICLLKKVATHDHQVHVLKKIEAQHPNIFAYVNIEDPQKELFFSFLQDEQKLEIMEKSENNK